MPAQLMKKVYSTHMRQCVCGHRSFSLGHEIDAVVYTLAGSSSVTVKTMRCNGFGCRTTFGPNFVIDQGKKVNTACPDDVAEVLFISPKVGFHIDYLKYHAGLQFRGFLTDRAVEDVYSDTFGYEHHSGWFREMHADAILYWLALCELHPLGLHEGLIIGAEISEDALKKYDEYLHKHVFPPRKKSSITELVGDGHAKVHLKCGQGYTHQGRPRKDGKEKPYGHGWFMLVNPKNLCIVSVAPMHKPENSAIVETSLLKVLPTYPKLDGFVMDRVCGFKLSSKGAAACTQIKYWAVDKFHAYGHKKSCKCNPRFVKRLSRRFAKTNTAACEQVFSRFRNYARVLNESRPCRHQFKVLLYAKMHNEAITRKKASYLNKFTVQTKVKGKSYACTKKPAAKK